MGALALLLFGIIFLLILKGYPVAFTLAGVSTLFALILMVFVPDAIGMRDLSLLPNRFMGTIDNFMLMAVPLFIFMGIMLEKSGLAESLLETMANLLGRLKGGLAISVVLVGAMLAASTGIVGATVVTMGVISLPVMLKRGYRPELATGVICSSGTLGQIIPPSVVLILLAEQINASTQGAAQVDVGTMFRAAFVPGFLLVVAYIVYIAVISILRPHWAPSVSPEEIAAFRGPGFLGRVLKAFVLPMLLILAVLGSIFAGIASPTEAAAVGAIGATVLTLIEGRLTLDILRQVMQQTAKLTAMVFWILLGATTFTLVFRTLGGDEYLTELIQAADLSAMAFLAIVMIVIFICGFFIDFIEIIFIFVPVVTPIFDLYEVDMLWVGILMAINLQTSFLTPPFGFSLFYLKGVAPPGITTQHLYRGIVPFIIIQVLVIGLIVLFPEIIYLIK
ncbi:TRAP transporter large permease [Neolewinella antarctica]|uniref:Tripartite ATP-independent transporter DctM subunit n=1 Tax=Neolewinella antarctica TaxID=442734 RepID=A0ABX0XAF8_9BACT|nr:TRAP transporter large permease subunit [Neolewinella antarctica]NJC25939.1 tripartite ATP-independent transporter DctM subunit [Neolewinella antarctica]